TAAARDHTVIRQVVTKSGEGASTIIIRLSDHPIYKVIPLEDKEMLIAFKDTEVSRGVYTNETIIGDELIQRIELEQKPSDVACMLVSLRKPCTEIGYDINDKSGMLCIEISRKARSSKKNAHEHEGAGLKGQGAKDDLLKVESKALTLDAGLFLGAVNQYRMGQWEKGVQILRKIIQSHPESPYLERAYFLLAKSFHRKFEKEIPEHLADIVEHYQAAMGKFPDSDYVPDAIVSIGNCYFAADDYYEALACYALVSEKHKAHPAAPEALFQRGIILASTKKPQEAIRDFDEIEKRYPKTRFAVRAKIEKAKALFDIKSFKRSLGILEEMINKEPDSVFKYPDILLYAGYDYYELGQLRKARHALSKALNYHPEMESNHLVLTKIAETYREEGAENKAAKLYDLVTRRYPDSDGGLVSLLRLADHRQKIGSGTQPSIPVEGKADIRPAREIYQQVIEKGRDNILSQLAMLKLALLHQKNKDYEQSIITLREMLAKYPNTTLKEEIKRALRAVLEPFFEQEKQAGRINNIISFYDSMKSVLSAEDMPNLPLIVGEAYSGLRLYSHAIPMFEKAGEFYADQDRPARLLLGLGECFYKIKRFDEAEQALKTFIERYPGHREIPKVHYWMGNIFLERNEYETALKFLGMALQQKIDRHYQAKILMATAEALNAQGEHEKAERSLRDAITLFDQLKDASSSDHLYVAYWELGETYIKLGQNEKAVSTFEKALKLDPQGSRRHNLEFRLAQCWQRLEATGKAKDMLDHIVTSGDPFWSNVADVQIKENNIKEGVEKFGYDLKES
ncbi:MAG: tetratricopeptide repeat protein, partial [Desulfobacterales bacterium]|nr:tetratricopeptide repeat protein [Desulfobacterales bacterium]